MRSCVLLLLLIVLMTAGCSTVRTPIAVSQPCKVIDASGLRSLLAQTAPPEEMRMRIAKAVGVSVNEVEFNLHEHQSAFLGIKRDGIAYALRMQGVQPVRVSVSFDLPPTAGAVIECLGAPRAYRARYALGQDGTNHPLSIHLFIPNQGAAVYAYTYGKAIPPPALDDSIPVSSIEYVLPARDENLTIARLLEGYGQEYRKLLESQLKPWPEAWENIQVDIDPALLCFLSFFEPEKKTSDSKQTCPPAE